MEVVVEKGAAKYLDRLDVPTKRRILAAIKGLESEPPQGDVIPLSGTENMHRLRIGGYRALFNIRNNKAYVTTIAPRGQAYK